MLKIKYKNIFLLVFKDMAAADVTFFDACKAEVNMNSLFDYCCAIL